jgi:hypothetical protein
VGAARRTARMSLQVPTIAKACRGGSTTVKVLVSGRRSTGRPKRRELTTLVSGATSRQTNDLSDPRHGIKGENQRGRFRCVPLRIEPNRRVRRKVAVLGWPLKFGESAQDSIRTFNEVRGSNMNGIIYIVGLVVIVIAVLSFFGLR